MGKPDGEQILNDTLDAFQQSVGREPDASEVQDIARVVAQEIKDQYDAK